MFLTLALALAAAPDAELLSDKIAVRVLVPAYVFPSTDPKSAEMKYWDALIAAASPECPVVAIINPASGPIDRKTPEMEPARVKAYTDLITRAAKENKHLRFVMYVPLANNTTKQIKGQAEYVVRADATDDIDAWLKHYPPAKHPNLIGFFLDEHPAFDNEQLAAARKVRHYAAEKLPDGPVFLNVGRATGGATILTRVLSNEVALLWEAPDKNNLKDKFALPAWADQKTKAGYVFARHRFAVLVHSKAKLEPGFVPLVAGKRVGWLYATDAGGANPWNKLPAYWDELVKAVAAHNGAKK